MPKDLLPPYECMTKEQDEAILHPDHKSLLVIGPPGCGKTVIALYRAGELVRKKKKVHVLVYGKVLLSYIDRSVKENDINIKTSTFHTWFFNHIKRTFYAMPPQTNKYDFDFSKIFEWYAEKGALENVFDHLVVDEGQDLPLDFFRLATRISGNLTVFADENQAIFQGLNSSIAEIRKAVRKFSPKEVHLVKNFRNTKRIAVFASLFMTEGIETGKTELPDKIGELPLLCKASNMNEQVEYIKNHVKTFPNKSVGVFLPTKDSVINYYNTLRTTYGENVQHYIGGGNVDPPDFGKDGIFVVTYSSAKGLEFDDVFVPDLHRFNLDDGQPVRKMQLYVVFTRPRDRLFLMYVGSTSISFQRIIDENNNHSELIKEISLNGHQVKENADVSNEKIKMSEFYDIISGEFGEFDTDRFIKIFRRRYQDTDFVNKKELEVCIDENIPGPYNIQKLKQLLYL